METYKVHVDEQYVGDVDLLYEPHIGLVIRIPDDPFHTNGRVYHVLDDILYVEPLQGD